MDTQTEQFSSWIGNSERHSDILTLAPLVAMAATLNKTKLSISEGFELPPLWHWLYFLNPAPQSALAADGHARKGDFLPPIQLPRRMWAGSRFEFHQALHAGEAVERTSTIKSINMKQGRSGQLAFVCVAHEITGENGLALSEEYELVFREQAAANATVATAEPAPVQADFRNTITPDPVFLFRYSALTFNGHRIHYDRDYVTNTEGYPGLIVHGPLLATLLVDALLQQIGGNKITKFKFRAMHPVFDGNDFQVCGSLPDSEGHCKLWIQDHAGALCMDASATVVIT